jgi:hypothetical protein
MPSFWNNDHPLTPMAEELAKRFIPSMGKTKFVESELLRAAMRIHYDHYNNGFGNNMSQAVTYIERYYTTPVYTPAFEKHYSPAAHSDFVRAFNEIKEQALEPSGFTISDENFSVFMSAILLNLQDAADAGTLTHIGEEMFDMPYIETVYQEDEYDYDSDEN